MPVRNRIAAIRLELAVLEYSEAIWVFDSGEQSWTTGAVASLVAQKPTGTGQSHPPEP